MTRLAALHARITGDASGFVTAAQQAEDAAQDASAAIGAAQAAGGRAGLAGAAGAARGALSRLTSSPGMRMLPIQLSQVAQQAAAGTGVMRALSIQAADIGLAFGAVGAIIGTLATVAMPLVIGAFSSGEEEAAALEETLDRLKNTTNALNEAQNILKMGLPELYEQYGIYAEQVRMVAQRLAELQIAQARTNLTEQIDLMSEALREFTMTSNSAFRSGTTQAQAIANLANQFGISSSEARQLEGALRAVRDAMTFEDRVAAMEQVSALFEEMGIDMATIPPELRAALIEMNNLTLATWEMQAAAAAAADEVARMNTAGMGPSPLGMSGADLLPPGEFGTGQGAELEEEGRRRSGGGGGGARQETFEDRLEKLREELEAETETIRQAHEDRLELLREAKERELLTNEEYHRLIEAERERFHDSLSGMDVYRYGEGLAVAEQFLGDMASAFASGNEEMMRISKIFAAAEALINAWRTYSQVMADPTLPWFAKLPAAISLFGSAIQAVSAIQGAGKGGSGRRTASGAAGAAQGAGGQVEAAGGGPSRPSVNLTLIGEQGFTRAQIVQIAEALNDSGDEGQQLVQIRGRR